MLPQDQALSPLGSAGSDEPESDEGFEGKWIRRGLRGTRSVGNYLTARSLMFKALEDGKISVSAPSFPVGDKVPFRQSYDYAGTRYNASSVSRITGRNLIRGALSKTTWIFALGTSLLGNIYDFTVSKNKDKSFQEFAVSTGVDTVMTVGTGLAAAGAVVLIAGLAGATLTVGPALLLTAVLGIGIGLVLDYFGAGDWVKQHVNNAVDSVEEGVHKFSEKVSKIPDTLRGIIENSKVIRDVVTDRVRESIVDTGNTIRRVATETIQNAKTVVNDGVKMVEEAVQQVGEDIKNTVTNIADGAKNILGGIFGGG